MLLEGQLVPIGRQGQRSECGIIIAYYVEGCCCSAHAFVAASWCSRFLQRRVVSSDCDGVAVQPMQVLRYRLLRFGKMRPSKWVCIHPQMCEWVREPKMQLQPSRLSGTANRSQRPANHRRPRLLEAREGRYAATLGSQQWLRCWVCDGEVSVVGACIGECSSPDENGIRSQVKRKQCLCGVKLVYHSGSRCSRRWSRTRPRARRQTGSPRRSLRRTR